jgi:hypothetical protein
MNADSCCDSAALFCASGSIVETDLFCRVLQLIGVPADEPRRNVLPEASTHRSPASPVPSLPDLFASKGKTTGVPPPLVHESGPWERYAPKSRH